MLDQQDMQHTLRHEDVLWLLGSLCGLFRIPFDASLIVQNHPPPYTLATLHEAARALGIKTGHSAISQLDWQKLPLPAIVFERPAAPKVAPEILPPTPEEGVMDVMEVATAADSPPTPPPPAPIAAPLNALLIVRASADTLLYFRPGSQKPETMAIVDITTRLTGDILLVAKESSAGADDDIAGFDIEKKEFGFRWFIPELLKHKAIWRDVLLASLAIQLVGLVTPLFTQVIIDKVIVHQTNSTLIVLGSALVMFMLFTSGMTWLRQYLVLHTGNRIDAVLGSQVLRHLLRLPLPYFELRSTGVLVARMHGVETIREFVSGAAVTLVLDFPFLLIFLAVMFAYSWQLSLIAVGLLGVIALMSFLVAPVFRDKLNRQFMLGARNQAFLTEYIAGMATVKSLQMEPDIDKKYGDYLAQYLAAGFGTKQIGNTYNVIANGVEQVMTLSILIVGALLVMQNDGFTVGLGWSGRGREKLRVISGVASEAYF